MKKLLLAFLLLTSSIISKGQDLFEKASINEGQPEEFFYDIVRFPLNLLSRGGEFNVLVSFIIKVDGTLDSVKVVSSPDKQASLEALNALEESNGLWNPTKINGVPINKRYIASFKYVTSTKFSDSKKKVEKLIEKGDYDKALKIINEGLTFNEYDKDLYQLRSVIYKKQNETDLLNNDLQKIEIINKDLLINMIISVGVGSKW